MSSRAPGDPPDPNAAPATPAPATPRNTGSADETPVAGESPELVRDTTVPSIELGATSGERRSRPVRRQSRGPSEDTLLSVPAPAASFEVEVEDRLSEHERRLDELASRLRTLEARQWSAAAPAGASTGSWLVWVVFLLALALAWQIFARGR